MRVSNFLPCLPLLCTYNAVSYSSQGSYDDNYPERELNCTKLIINLNINVVLLPSSNQPGIFADIYTIEKNGCHRPLHSASRSFHFKRHRRSQDSLKRWSVLRHHLSCLFAAWSISSRAFFRSKWRVKTHPNAQQISACSASSTCTPNCSCTVFSLAADCGRTLSHKLAFAYSSWWWKNKFSYVLI